MYELTGDPIWMTRATDWQTGLEGRKNDTSTHDVGFVIFSSFGNGYRLTGIDAYRQVVLTAAGSLATRYNAKVGCIKSWNGGSSDFKVIVDNMMNLEILFWASKHGGSAAWYDMAVSHALRTMTDHVRADGSTYQVVNYDPKTGAVKAKSTNQGASTESTWSRGQAWAIHGFTMAFRETGDQRFLDTARRTADYFIGHLPADLVPYWDFEAPGIPNEPRDSSAAAIAAAGLLELGWLETDPSRSATDISAARGILASLSSPAYLSEGTGNQAILLHGTQNKPDGKYDRGLIYGDYYLLQALLRSPAVIGRVTDRATGLPISGASVTAGPATTRSRVVGDYSLVGLGSGARTITVSAAGYVPATAGVGVPDAGSARLDVALDRAIGPTPTPTATPTTTPTATPTGTPGGGTIRLGPIADAQVKSSSPSTNYGTLTTIRVRDDPAADPIIYRTYLRFDVTGLSGPPSAVRLRLYVTDASVDGGTVYAVANTWTETGLTWTTAPPLGGAALGGGGATPAVGSWLEIALAPGAVPTDGTYSFAVRSSSTDSAIYASREDASHRPELVLVGGS
jgi:unsaturated chondroitin disaccharide hydrolase